MDQSLLFSLGYFSDGKLRGAIEQIFISK